ncbi:MAG: hypothetical protein HFJ40_05860 [Clostridia bacterium]|nr:hypothetical protein [Clostridia bacterium]
MITVYATITDYFKYGSEVIEDDEIEKYLELASIDINKATLTRIEKRGFENLTLQQRDLIIKATCIQAEHIKEEGTYDNEDLSSYSIGGDLTVNTKEANEINDKLKMSKLAFFYLKRTGLTSRII